MHNFPYKFQSVSGEEPTRTSLLSAGGGDFPQTPGVHPPQSIRERPVSTINNLFLSTVIMTSGFQTQSTRR